MKINSKNSINKFKSINIDIDLVLPDITLITGLNGSGKTHLLEGIYDCKIKVEDETFNVGQFYKGNMTYINGYDLLPQESIISSELTREKFIIEYYDKYKYFVSKFKTNEYATPNYHGMDKKQNDFVYEVAELENKSKDTLLLSDFQKHYPYYILEDLKDIFQHNLSETFKGYSDKILKNIQNRKLASVDSTILAYNDFEFEEKFGKSPWLIINEILKNSGLNFTIKSPLPEYDSKEDFRVKLISNLSDNELLFSDLSSGERVIMSLVIAIFNSEKSLDFKFPDLLLLDEPDATLHPSLSKVLLKYVSDILVKQKGMKVIMTTHSPSTIAFAEEEWIYLMTKDLPRLEKTTKDKALSILCSGVPTFSVNYENRRQVFVEDPNDVIFYEKLYNNLKPKLIKDVSLSFISGGESKKDKNGMSITGCDQVRNIVTILSDNGNKFIKGLIDWDLKNEETQNIKILGFKKRYSIENYILDPLLIAALLIREKFITPEELNINFVLETELLIQSNEVLNSIANYVIDKIKIKNEENKLVEIEYCNGKKIKIPQWYLITNGHKLEELIVDAFPMLRKISRGNNGTNALKNEILDKIIANMPGFIPFDILDVMSKLQN